MTTCPHGVLAAPMKQSTESFLRIEAAFHEALEASAEARPTLIAQHCGGDPALIAEVQSLLKACEEEEHLTASRHVDSDARREILPGSRTAVIS